MNIYTIEHKASDNAVIVWDTQVVASTLLGAINTFNDRRFGGDVITSVECKGSIIVENDK